ncbi:MAG: hypothetical protein PHE74_11960 [Comamonas sp.]|jgi:hypothetical protein|nr:hypothetical protein [Comamonas sp.]
MPDFSRQGLAALLVVWILVGGQAGAQPLGQYPELDPGNPALLEEVRHLHQQVEQALQRRDWLQAELLLERILMLQPENAQAMLQMAMVLNARERRAGAQALIAALRDDKRTAPAHRQRLQALLDAQNHPYSLGLTNTTNLVQPRTQLLVSLGRSTNPLARPSARSIHLTLPDADVELELSERPRSAFTSSVLLYRRFASGLELVLSGQDVTAPDAHTSARLALAGPIAQGWLWSVSSQQGLDGERRDSAGLMYSRAGARTQQLYALSAFRANPDGYYGLLARAQASMAPTPSLQMDSWVELERARQPHALRLGVQAQWRLAPSWQLQGYVLLQQDLSGYSPLLKNNAARRIATSYLALEKSWPWHSGQLIASTYFSQRVSNLALFSWRDYGLTFGWRRSW